MNTNIFLHRNPSSIIDDDMSKEIQDKVILVTGAGGSIGSEICIQCKKMKAKTILLVDNSEFSLYKIHKTLSDDNKCNVIPLLVDVKDQKFIEKIISTYTPTIVFHAAAYKHVPLVENNQLIGLINNVIGTWTMANACLKSSVEKFVMISTDKAVNPTSIMGMTKLISEMFVIQMNKKSNTCKFTCVRFGNVLGSSGSVIPLFEEQISNGGPITVTHKDMKRYFMTISEAVSLVLKSISLDTQDSHIFILDMGQPIKIVTLAEDLIRSHGLVPYDDIKIEFTGIRPGEKLFEELSINKLSVIPTKNSKIFAAVESIHEKSISIDDIYDVINNFDITDDIHKRLKFLIYGKY